MSKRRPLPYHALDALENAETLICQAQRALKEMLAEPRPAHDVARLARVGWELSDALRRLSEIERNKTGGN